MFCHGQLWNLLVLLTCLRTNRRKCVCRYLRDAKEQAGRASNQTMYLQTASKREVEVQLLGEDEIRDHQAHLELATQATLDSERVSSIVSCSHASAFILTCKASNLPIFAI